MGYTGSHRVSEHGDKVVIHDLSLFSGFDPSIDRGDDAEINAFNPAKVKQVFERTQQFMRRRQLPKIVLRHDRPGRVIDPEAKGSVKAIRFEERAGVGNILGDVEMRRVDFDSLIASNAYPGRSAEIHKPDLHMHRIALLGRETPRRPLEDTRFESSDDSILCESPEDTEFEGAQNPIPELVDDPKSPKNKKGKKNMEDAAKIASLENEVATLKSQMATVVAASESIVNEKGTLVTTLQAERAADRARIAELESRNASHECEQIVDRMELDGMLFGPDVKKTMVNELLKSSDRAATEKVLRSIGRKLDTAPLSRHLRAAPADPVGGKRQPTPVQVIECQKLAVDPKTGEYDAAKFNLEMEKCASGGE